MSIATIWNEPLTMRRSCDSLGAMMQRLVVVEQNDMSTVLDMRGFVCPLGLWDSILTDPHSWQEAVIMQNDHVVISDLTGFRVISYSAAVTGEGVFVCDSVQLQKMGIISNETAAALNGIDPVLEARIEQAIEEAVTESYLRQRRQDELDAEAYAYAALTGMVVGRPVQGENAKITNSSGANQSPRPTEVLWARARPRILLREQTSPRLPDSASDC